MRSSRLVFALVAALAIPVASASVDRSVLLVNEIRSQQQEIRAGVETRAAPYDDLSPAQRAELLSKQSRMLHLLDGKHSTDDLNEQQKVEVFNTLEWIEAVVNNAEDDRMVCERRPILGSNRKERICKTAGQWRAEREAAREQLDSRNRCRDCNSN
jgi:hypothetical protein